MKNLKGVLKKCMNIYKEHNKENKPEALSVKIQKNTEVLECINLKKWKHQING
jgi:hypothetical protein